MSEPNQSKRRMPANSLIVRYWEDQLGENLEGICFACGSSGCDLERAHIVARAIGGTDDADNLHLLCHTCHKDSEFTNTASEYWGWFDTRTMVDKMVSMAIRHMGLQPTAYAMDGYDALLKSVVKSIQTNDLRTANAAAALDLYRLYEESKHGEIPELTEEFFRRADMYDGEMLVKRGER